jgi:hypothetical protein
MLDQCIKKKRCTTITYIFNPILASLWDLQTYIKKMVIHDMALFSSNQPNLMRMLQKKSKKLC